MKTYDFKKVAVIVNGRQITGFAEGSSVKVARRSDAFELEIGADGEGVRSKSNDFSGSIEFQLQQGADSNQILSDLAAADEAGNTGVVAVLIKDQLGGSLHAAEQAWIKKAADAGYAKKADSRTWVLETDKLVHNVGNN